MKYVGALLLLLMIPLLAFASPSEDEAAVWQLEGNYLHDTCPDSGMEPLKGCARPVPA